MTGADGAAGAGSEPDRERPVEPAERNQLELLVEHVPAALYIDERPPPGTFAIRTIYVGPQVSEVLGTTAEAWTGNDDLWREIMHPDDWPETFADYARFLEEGGNLSQEYRIIRPDNGKVVWVRDVCRIVMDPTTGRDIVLGVMFDISAQKDLENQLREAEAALQFQATHDPLTGLGNRTLFREALNAAVARAKRSGRAVALLFCDVDGFKHANDTFGHDAGDEILAELARRIAGSVRDADVVGRFGGDEFVILVPDIDLPATGVDAATEAGGAGRAFAAGVAGVVASRITASLDEPIEFSGGTIALEMSIGCALFPFEAPGAPELLSRADAAMYAAKPRLPAP